MTTSPFFCAKFRFVYALLVAVALLAQLPAGAVADDDGAAADATAQAEVQPQPAEDEYYDLLKLFADTMDQIDRNYVTEISRRELMEAAIAGMMAKLDPYSNYIPPKELDRFKSGVDNEFGGVGIQISLDDDRLTVISPLVGSPAYKAGIQAGDRIVKIGDKPTKGMSLDDAVKRLKGKVNTKIKVTVQRPHDNSTKVVELKRSIVQVETVLGDTRTENDAWNYFFDEENKIGYIRLSAFGRRSADELQQVVQQLQSDGLQGLVLDLRFNPGGLLSSAIEIADLFIDDGMIVSTAGRNAPSRKWEAHDHGTFVDFPMVVLVNRFSASASEIVAACLQDHARATVIGERTWGKGSVQNIIELEGGRSALKLTTAGYQRPNGKNIHRTEDAESDDEWGVRPNDGFEVQLSAGETHQIITARRQKDIIRPDSEDFDPQPTTDDSQLAKAIEFLLEKLKEAADEEGATEDADATVAKNTQPEES